MKRLFIIGGSLLVLLVIVMIWKSHSGGGNIRIAVEKAALHDITEIVSASGKVQSEDQVDISSDVSGEIIELNVKEGDTVKKGDLLLRINPIIYQSTVAQMQATLNSAKANLATTSARLEQSKANFTNAEAAFNRNKKLHDQGAISDADFDQSKATYLSATADVAAATQSMNSSNFNVSNAEASLQQAQDNLAKTTIYAPVSGTVSKLNVLKGERVVGTAQMAGTVILTLANLNEMEVQVDVNENDILRVQAGDTALIEVDAHDNRKFKGIVTEVASSANTTGVTADQVTNFPVKIRILRESYADLIDKQHPDRYVFLPGMSATVDIQTKSVRNAISVPIQAVTTRADTSSKSGMMMDKDQNPDDNNGGMVAHDTKDNEKKKTDNTSIMCVFVYNNGTAKLVPVKTGIEDNMYIQVLSGLKEGDEVIVAPYSAISAVLFNGALIDKVSKDQLMEEQ